LYNQVEYSKIGDKLVVRHKILGVAVLSAATMILETSLTRFFAVTQFYHFAFLVISLALLGFGFSGTLLSVLPQLRKISFSRMLFLLGLSFTVSVGLAYFVINFLPFDSYSIAWDRKQYFLFAFYYLVLTIPFTISGLAVGSALSQRDHQSHIYYASNLLGSGVGALIGPVILGLAGVPGAIIVSIIFGLIVSLVSLRKVFFLGSKHKWCFGALLPFLAGNILVFIALVVLNSRSNAPLGMTISPYKGLAQALRYPNSETIFSRWDAVARIDLIVNSGIHQMPGLSYLYDGLIPEQVGVSLDANALQAFTLIHPDKFDAAAFLPESIAFDINPKAEVLVLNPGGGLGVLQALTGRAKSVKSVVNNDLVPQSILSTYPTLNYYSYPEVQKIIQSERVFLHSGDETFDIVFLPLTDPYLPISSGAYTLNEDYSLTVDAFEAIISKLKPAGIFVFTRWIQTPPSESLRSIALVVEALDNKNISKAADSIVVFRGIQTVTIMVSPDGWPPDRLEAIRNFTQDKKFDLVWLPDIQDHEVNRYNRLPQPHYFLAVQELLTTQDRERFYSNYPYDIKPPIDDHPYFFHYFTWKQAPKVWASLGHTWQPFGGSGYFVLIALLALIILLSIGLILFPSIWLFRKHTISTICSRQIVIYFSLLGIAFMFIEIPLIQRCILLFGHPTYAFTIVVAVLLCFSGFGSYLSKNKIFARGWGFLLLIFFSIFVLLFIFQFLDFLLSLPLWMRVTFSIIGLAPLGLLMGLPFPLGISLMEEKAQAWIPMAWAINGCVSVIASVLAAIMSLSYGITMVQLLGVAAYACAAYCFTRMLNINDCLSVGQT
jgi:hypothetical protein